MRMDELAAPAIDAVRDGRVRIVPDNHRRVYLDWMENIRPWCISRQLWWGHRLPVYYCDDLRDTSTSRPSAPERCEACGGELRQEEDVLDTWFSSALWPFATLGWPEQTPQLRAFYPTDGALHRARHPLPVGGADDHDGAASSPGEVPFADVYIHSVIQAPDGRRMSKSLGTGIDPLDEIDRHGADAVRFGLLAMSSTQDVRYSAEKVQPGAGARQQALQRRPLRAAADRRDCPESSSVRSSRRRGHARSRTAGSSRACSEIVADTAARIEDYDFSHAALGLYDFVYGELCDWYLEIVKPRLATDRGSAERGGAGR